MDALTIFLGFALTLVAIVALGRPVRGRIDGGGAEIHAGREGGRCTDAMKKSL